MRRKGVRAAAVGLVMATFVATGCTAEPAHPAANPAPTAGAPSSNSSSIDLDKLRIGSAALRHHRCEALIREGNLAAPFWLDNEHFDPATARRTHTPAEALTAYRSDPATRGWPRLHLHVAYADYSVTWKKEPPTPVWIVLRYGVLGTPSMGRPARVDMAAIINDQDLHSVAIIESLPSRCH